MKPTSILIEAESANYSHQKEITTDGNLDALEMLFNLIVIDGYLFFLMIVFVIFWIKIEKNKTEDTIYWKPTKARSFNDKDF